MFSTPRSKGRLVDCIKKKKKSKCSPILSVGNTPHPKNTQTQSKRMETILFPFNRNPKTRRSSYLIFRHNRLQAKTDQRRQRWPLLGTGNNSTGKDNNCKYSMH